MATKFTQKTADVIVGGGCLVATLLFFGLGIVGWVWNIGKLVAGAADPISLVTIMRIIGIPFIPLGCVLGWF